MTRSSWFGSAGLLADECGAVLVEATVFLPMLLLLALATFEFGRALENHHAIVKAMRDAARYLGRVPITCPGGTFDNSADVTTAENIALTGEESGGTPRLAYWTDPATITITVNCFNNTAGTYYGSDYLPLVTVSAAVPYVSVGVLDMLGLGALTFNVAHEEVNFGE